MKRHRVVVLVGSVLLIVAIGVLPVFAACAKLAPSPATPASKPPQTPAPVAAPGEKVQKLVRVASGGAGSMMIIFATAMSQVLTKYAGIEVAIEEARQKAVYPLMNSGDMDIVTVAPMTPLEAYQGIGVEKTRIRDLATLAPPGVIIAVIMTRPDTGIKGVKDLRGKVVNAESPGQPWYAQVMDGVLKANGMTRTDMKWLKFEQVDAAVRDLAEKRIDASIMPMGTRVIELSKSVGAFVIPLTPQEQAGVVAIQPAFMAYTVPKGFYELAAQVPTVASPTHFFIRAGMNDITAYTIIKTLFEHLDELYKVHEQLTGLVLKSALSQIVVPIHPGAIRYYKEAGVWTKDHDAKQQELLAREKTLFGDK